MEPTGVIPPCSGQTNASDKPLVVISACLLGENVRYNGKNKLDICLRDLLGRHVKFLPVCPEVECGMGVPRPPIQLFDIAGSTRLMTIDESIDFTERMNKWAREKLKELSFKNICGFVLKSGSPSCGPEGIDVFRDGNILKKDGIGMFAQHLFSLFTTLPVISDKMPLDRAAIEKFLKQVHEIQGFQINGQKARLFCLTNSIQIDKR